MASSTSRGDNSVASGPADPKSTSTAMQPVASTKGAQVSSQPKRGFSWLMLGGCASMMAATCTHPLDLVKVRLQTLRTAKATTASQASKMGMLSAGRNVVATEGVSGLYKGLTASLARQATYSTTRFAAYDYIKDRYIAHKAAEAGTDSASASLAVYERIGIAMCAGGLGGFVGNPMDVSLVRMQDDGRLPPGQRRNYKHIFDALSRMVRDEGLLKLYSGVGPNVQRAMLMSAGQIASYDTFKQMLLTMTGGLFKDNLVTHFSASILAGGVATIICQPFDVIKTRVMASSPGQFRGVLHCLAVTVRDEGPTALYKGTVPSFTRLGPQTILTFVFLEQLRRLHTLMSEQGDKDM